MQPVDFHAPHLALAVEALPEAEIDALPFGVIKLDPEGNVALYNRTERIQSGYKNRPTLGLAFFTDIAPCMNTPAMKGRIDAAVKSGEVDMEVGWVGDFNDPERALVIRCQSASDGGLWVFLNRPAG